MPVVQQPEAYIGNTAALLDENGKVKNQGTIQFLQSFVDTFVDLIKKISKVSFIWKSIM